MGIAYGQDEHIERVIAGNAHGLQGNLVVESREVGLSTRFQSKANPLHYHAFALHTDVTATGLLYHSPSLQ